MPTRAHIQTGQTEPVIILVTDVNGDPLPGKSDIVLRMRRVSDGYYLDWSDSFFKVESSVVTPQTAMAETEPNLSPGQYHLTSGFNSSFYNNVTADDTYVLTAYQSTGTDAANVPQIGEIKVGSFVDDIVEDRYPVIF